MTVSVMGIDLSLTSTGLAGIESDGTVWVDRIRTTGKKTDDLTARRERLSGIAEEIVCRVDGDADDVDLVVVESPSYGSTYGSPHDRSGLWWLVVDALHELEVPVATVSPQGRAKYGTGKGNAKKADVYAAVKAHYIGVDFACDDEADALLLASMGARYLGYPIEGDRRSDFFFAKLPAVNLEAMAGAAWPV